MIEFGQTVFCFILMVVVFALFIAFVSAVFCGDIEALPKLIVKELKEDWEKCNAPR